MAGPYKFDCSKASTIARQCILALEAARALASDDLSMALGSDVANQPRAIMAPPSANVTMLPASSTGKGKGRLRGNQNDGDEAKERKTLR